MAALLAAALAMPSLAGAHFQRLTSTPSEEPSLAVAGDEVYVGSAPTGGFATVRAHSLTGGVRDVPLPGTHELIEEINATREALTVLALTRRANGYLRGYFGPPTGPMRILGPRWIDAAVTGRTVVTIQNPSGRRQTAYVRRREIDGDGVRRLPLRGSRFGAVASAGRYVAVIRNHANELRSTIAVLNLHDGRERFAIRVPFLSQYGLAPTGRIVAISARGGRTSRILTASPRRPRPRTLARIPLHRLELAVARRAAMIVIGTPRGAGRVVKLSYTGRRQALTPPIPDVGGLVYDGETAAFSTGLCVYGGPAVPGLLLPPVDHTCAAPVPTPGPVP